MKFVIQRVTEASVSIEGEVRDKDSVRFLLQQLRSCSDGYENI